MTIITQTATQPNKAPLSPRERLGEGCRYCAAEAVPNTRPPLCGRHIDIAVLIGFAQGTYKPVTPESLTEIYNKATARGGQWDIAAEEIPGLLDELLRDDPAGEDAI